jgi:hypothetical protein
LSIIRLPLDKSAVTCQVILKERSKIQRGAFF